MTALHAWLSKPRASVRIDTSVRWGGWVGILRQLSSRKRKPSRPRLEVLDRLSLGGKKSLLLVSVSGRRVLVAVGETSAPSITPLGPDHGHSVPAGRGIRSPRARKMVSA